jgi:hypothetical protein
MMFMEDVHGFQVITLELSLAQKKPSRIDLKDDTLSQDGSHFDYGSDT